VGLDLRRALAELHPLRLAGVLATRLIPEHGIAQKCGKGWISLAEFVPRFLVRITQQARELAVDSAQDVGKNLFHHGLFERWRRLERHTTRRCDPFFRVEPQGGESWKTGEG
jgi:hypothetical protein